MNIQQFRIGLQALIDEAKNDGISPTDILEALEEPCEEMRGLKMKAAQDQDSPGSAECEQS
jgi:hypothetical protein